MPTTFRLQSLLDLRRRREDAALAEVVAAGAARATAEAEQSRLDALTGAARARLAAARVSVAPGTAAAVQGAERLRLRRAEELAAAAALAAAHRTTTVVAAMAAEAAARLGYANRRMAREAVEKLMTRRAAEGRRVADRRAEDAASDLHRAGARP